MPENIEQIDEEQITFIIANISRRSSDQSRDTEFLHVLGHVNSNNRILAVE